ncbi:Isochorismate pyruvate-lyase [Rhodovulum sp. P5]|uniref:chorismate mutase n=1 Tax=Rhodovulum sp. P5 TaxID=1564506 RepID=UPI0009C35A03|nr:chorismate mutase [Rhodovulum sp. P5]ARE39791.1 Isochorismate pyruvate-lyase [Rhodovulum sp. P5]
MTPPEACQNMKDLRLQIDTLDAEIVSLLARRARFIDRAAELKPGEGLPARIGARIDEVIRNVRHHAGKEGLDPDLAETMWRELIEWSIHREEAAMADGKKQA